MNRTGMKAQPTNRQRRNVRRRRDQNAGRHGRPGSPRAAGIEAVTVTFDIDNGSDDVVIFADIT